MVCRAPQLLEKEALFINFILWSDMDRNPEMGGNLFSFTFFTLILPQGVVSDALIW